MAQNKMVNFQTRMLNPTNFIPGTFIQGPTAENLESFFHLLRRTKSFSLLFG